MKAILSHFLAHVSGRWRKERRDDGGKSAQKAATSSIWAASTPDIDGVTGRYFDSGTKERELRSTAYDPRVQAHIVSPIEDATG